MIHFQGRPFDSVCREIAANFAQDDGIFRVRALASLEDTNFQSE